MNRMKTFPICLFAFNRPDKLTQCIDAILDNANCQLFELYVFCDGPRNIDEYEIVERVRVIARSITGFKNVTVHESNTNKGLANSVIDGVSLVLEANSGVIVLEDDILVSTHFLEFMNEALNTYENDPEIASVHGNFPSLKFGLPSTFLLKYSDCWGWGTWKDSWTLLNLDSLDLMNLIRESERINEFNVYGAYPFFDLLQKEYSGAVDSWAIRWHASLFVNHKLSLYSKFSLIYNIGTDGSGRHKDSFNLLDRRSKISTPQLTRISIRPNRLATIFYAFGLLTVRFKLLARALLQWAKHMLSLRGFNIR